MAVIATTAQGKLEGTQQDGVHAFKGVPFAAPPLGSLRFAAPQPADGWSGVRDATRSGPAAPQPPGFMRDIPDWDEDCLNLNVWTPGLTGRRPVMVYLHGGGFTTGSGSQETYPGAKLAAMGDLVVVAINYRLGALGFAHFGELMGDHHGIDSNRGLRDQIMALGWVRDNIEAFGGDPQSVTLFGQSAGAMSIGSLLSAQQAGGLFQRAIAQSGATHHITTPPEAMRMADVLLAALDITAEYPQRLWQVTAQELVAAQASCEELRILRGPAGRRLPQGGMTLIPVADGGLLPMEPLDAVAAGLSAKVPLLVGSNRDEWNLYTLILDTRRQALDPQGLIKVLDARIDKQGERAVEVYRAACPDGEHLAPHEVFSVVETDRMFRIPAIRLAEAQQGVQPDTFMYRFDRSSPLLDGRLGACHGAELPYVFGSTAGEFGRLFTGGGPGAEQLSDKIMDAWIAFARTGNPSCDSVGDWPRYDPKHRATMLLDDRCAVEDDPVDAERAFWDGIQ